MNNYKPIRLICYKTVFNSLLYLTTNITGYSNFDIIIIGITNKGKWFSSANTVLLLISLFSIIYSSKLGPF